jgi:hypothetical protein
VHNIWTELPEHTFKDTAHLRLVVCLSHARMRNQVLVDADNWNTFVFVARDQFSGSWLALEDCRHNCDLMTQGLIVAGKMKCVRLRPIEMGGEKAVDEQRDFHIMRGS